MPLTSPRPGLFRGRAYEKWAWYVVNPAAGSDPRDIESSWLENFAATNSTRLRVFGRRVLPWFAAASILAATVYVLVRITPSVTGSWLYVVYAALVIIGLLSATVAAVVLYVLLTGPAVVPSPMWGEVLELDPEIVEWITPTSTPEEAWRIQRALFELRQVQNAVTIWEIGPPDDTLPSPDWAIEDVVMPVLEGQLVEKYALVEEASTKHGFTVPPSILEHLPEKVRDRMPSALDGSVVSDTV